jgi:hypothetical protein
MSAQLGENATQNQLPVTAVHGLLYFVQNPLLRGYTDTLGGLLLLTAKSFPLGENATHLQRLPTAVHGSLYLVPNPLLRGYTDILGAVLCATAMSISYWLVDNY